MKDIARNLNEHKGKFKHLSIYLVASIISSVIAIAANPFLAQGLSHEDYAIIGYFSSFGSLLSPIISFSLSSYYARNYNRVSEEERKSIYQTILSMFLVLSLGTFLLFYFGYYIYHANYVKSVPFTPFALLSFLPTYFYSFYNLYLVDLRMKNKSKVYAIVTVSNYVIAVLLSIILVYLLPYGAIGRLSALLINVIIISLYSLKVSNFKFTWETSIVKDLLKFCWPLALSGVLSFFFLGVDRPMLEKINDNYNLGLYNVGLQISSYLAIFGTVLLQTFDPDLYKYTSTNQHKKVFFMIIFVVALSAIPNIVFMFVSKPIISLLTAGRYVESAAYANILCIKNIATTFAFVMSGVLIGYGYSKCELYNKIIGAVVSFGLYYFLINNWSYYGAAWGQSLSWVAMGIISLVSLYLMRRYESRS